MRKLERWLLIKLLQRRLNRMLKELELVPEKGWNLYRKDLIEEINDLKYMLSGLHNEQNNE